jgi:Spy/CpxP family protein refolding chaperone
MDSIKENAREQIRRVLTPEQNEGFTALIREMNDTTARNQQN